MSRDFVDWFDGYLAREGPSAVAKGLISLLGLAGLLGAILGNTAIKAGGIIFVLLAALAGMLYLLRDRGRFLNETELYRRLLIRYCAVIADKPKAVARIRSWHQVAVVKSNGDTRETIKIHAVCLRKELHFLRLKFSTDWDQPAATQKKVSVRVRGLSINGTRGASWDITSSWTGLGKLELLAHLHNPAHLNSDIRLEIIWDWPGKCLPLTKGKPDSFTFEFNKFMPIEFAKYEVILPRDATPYHDPIGFDAESEQFSITPGRSDDGRPMVTFEGENLPAGGKIGMRLELGRGYSPLRGE